MKKLTIIFTLFLLGLGLQAVNAQSQKIKDRSAFISNTKLLEKKPLDPNAGIARNWNFKYVADTDEVSVVICSGTMKLLPEKKNKFKGELLMQFTFGMAVFKLENPDKKDDENAAQSAGLESALKTYEMMIAEDPKAKSPGMDELLAKRNNGELAKAVADAGCGKK